MTDLFKMLRSDDGRDISFAIAILDTKSPEFRQYFIKKLIQDKWNYTWIGNDSTEVTKRINRNNIYTIKKYI